MALSEAQVSAVVDRIMQRLGDGTVPGTCGAMPAGGAGGPGGQNGGAPTSSRTGSTLPVAEVAARLRVGARGLPGGVRVDAHAVGRLAGEAALQAGVGTTGAFKTADEAVSAAGQAARQAETLPLSARYAMVEAMREASRTVNARISEWAVEESGLGRVEDKLKKNPLLYEKTPGPEILEPKVVTGDDGLTLIERAPYGVIAAITPTTNPTETIICNAIAMVSGANAVVVNAHPAAAQVSRFMVDVLGRAIVAAGGPPNLVSCVAEPTIESAQALMVHPGVRLLVVTGGPGVVKQAMQSGKKVIAAGPGNPPAVVDETADLERAARHIMLGASLDNNIVCIAEKEVVAVDAVADRLLQAFRALPVVVLDAGQVAALEKVVIAERPSDKAPHGALHRRFIGKNAGVILNEIGITVGPEVRLALADVGHDRNHPFVQMEMMMPVLPVVRTPDVGEAIRLAKQVEHGCGHTATMHSRNIEALSEMARTIDTSILVKNGPSYAGLGLDGEGYTSFTIASPTGEGLTTALNFTRERRCTLKDSFRIV